MSASTSVVAGVACDERGVRAIGIASPAKNAGELTWQGSYVGEMDVTALDSRVVMYIDAMAPRERWCHAKDTYLCQRE